MLYCNFISLNKTSRVFLNSYTLNNFMKFYDDVDYNENIILSISLALF